MHHQQQSESPERELFLCRKDLDRLINGRYPAYPVFAQQKKQIISRILQLNRQLQHLLHTPVSPSVHVVIQPYNGTNRQALLLKDIIRSRLHSFVTDVILHGSIATQDECDYSDFDVLVIIKKSALVDFRSISTFTALLRKINYHFLKTDILQHHGWFILTEHDLNCLDISYFPAEVMVRGKSLLHDSPITHRVAASVRCDFVRPFTDVANKTLALSGNHILRMNLYEIKTVLSRIFLLPALYFQARYKKGIYKGDSFEVVKKEFDPVLWQPVIDASEIRLKWKQNVHPLRIRLLRMTLFFPMQVRQIFYPRSESELRKKVAALIPGIRLLVNEMKNRIAQS